MTTQVKMTMTEIIKMGMESHYTCHGYYPGERDAIYYGLSLLTEGRLSPGEIQDMLSD